MGVEVYQALKLILKSKGYAIAVGDEGGYAPQFKSNEEPFQILMEAIQKAGYVPGKIFVWELMGLLQNFFERWKISTKKRRISPNYG